MSGWQRILPCIAMLAMSLLTAPTAGATGNDIPRMASGKPDFTGVWQALNEADLNLEPHGASQGPAPLLGALGAVRPGLGVIEGGSIPYRPEALAQRKTNFDHRRAVDPEAKCFLPGVPRATYLPHPFQIIQSDNDILIAYQYAGALRPIYMSDHQDAPIDSWMGWSNGHWEGDTLVVEVTGQNGQSWLDRAGNYASNDLSVVERYRFIDAGHLQYEATLTDPSIFTRPWTIRMPLYRRIEPGAQILEFKCAEFAEDMMYGDLYKDPPDLVPDLPPGD